MMLRAKRGLMSRISPWSTIARIELVHVVRLARRLGEQVEQRLVAAVDRIGRTATSGGGSSQLDGKNERYFFIGRDARRVVLELAVADAAHLGVDLRAAELLLGDLLPGHRLDERRARRARAMPMSFTIGT